MKIPIAEHFHSLQGEGYWVGTPMHFVRMAGCSVGRIPTRAFPTPKLPNGQPAWECHDFANRPFWCDTDFSKYAEVETEELIADTWEHHICLTGGEPLIHPVAVFQLAQRCIQRGIQLHIETSGTIDVTMFQPISHHDIGWITVSPKAGYLPQMIQRADEVKLLVSGHDSYGDLLPLLQAKPYGRVFLSPINSVTKQEGGSVLQEHSSQQNLQWCMELLRSYPEFRLSVQLHKYLGLR